MHLLMNSLPIPVVGQVARKNIKDKNVAQQTKNNLEVKK